MLDFPASPTNGQKYPTTSIPGVPTYTWDGEKWVTVTNVSGGGGSGSSSIIISDTPPTGVPDGTLWWESDSGLLYIRYNDGTSTQWVIAAPQPDVNAFVQYGVQTPTVAQQTQARQNVYAAPFDALAYSGMQVNGSFEVSQEFGTAWQTFTTAYFMDGWKYGFSNAAGGALQLQQYSIPSSTIIPGVYFQNAMLMSATTALPSIATGSYAYVNNIMEGYRTARLAWGMAGALPITISFWIFASASGSLAVSAANNPHDRSYLVDVPITGGVYQYKTVTIPGDVIGNWDKGATTGLNVMFCFGAGATWQGTPNTWLAGNKFATPNTTNFFSATII